MSQFSLLEQEIIVLWGAWDLIGEMVNHEQFEFRSTSEGMELWPPTRVHHRLFTVLLVDLLALPRHGLFDLPPAKDPVTSTEPTGLAYLAKIAEHPKLSTGEPTLLRESVAAFSNWLDSECIVPSVYLPAIGWNGDLKLRRIEFINICGNISKHGFARLDRDVRQLIKIIAKNGPSPDPFLAYLALPEFYEWFHENVLRYHVSTLGEFLTDIQWGIYEYVRSEFERSFRRDNPATIRYTYDIPRECAHPMTQAMYWSLMNGVRSKPYVPRFAASRMLKLRY